MIILGVSSEEISDADHSAAKRTPVLHAAEILLLPCSHSPCTHSAHTRKGGFTVITELLWKPQRFKRHVTLRRIKKQRRNSHLFLWCVQRCRHLFVDHCFLNPVKNRKTSDSIIVNKMEGTDLLFMVTEHDFSQFYKALNCSQSIFLALRHVCYLPQIVCTVFLSSLATWATRSYSTWQRTFRCKRAETEGGNTLWDEWGQDWWLGVIINNCFQATAHRNRIKIRNSVKNVKRWAVGTGENASKLELQNQSCLKENTGH